VHKRIPGPVRKQVCRFVQQSREFAELLKGAERRGSISQAMTRASVACMLSSLSSRNSAAISHQSHSLIDQAGVDRSS
jgi:hypothetical protein